MTATAAVGPVVLPELDWVPTAAKSSRNGQHVQRVVAHRWGVRFTTEQAEALSYHGVVRFFQEPRNDASSHLVHPGSAVPGRATQMVPWDEAAWTEAAYNRSSVEVECADAIWLGHDPRGLQETARIVAFLLHKYGLPALWSKERGFCRHADLGAAGGGHTSCPTTNLTLWHAFAALVVHEHQRGGFRTTWGR
jgi:hypothetical protein